MLLWLESHCIALHCMVSHGVPVEVGFGRSWILANLG